MTSGGMNFADSIRISFEKDYPWGSKLHYKASNDSNGTKNPHYIQFILKAMERGMTKPKLTCLVFPKKGFAAHAAWATLSTDKLAREVLPTKVKEFSDRQLSELKINDLVSTYPGDKVFVWGGESMHRGERYLTFKLIGKSSSQVGLPVSTFSPLRIKKYPGTNPPTRQIGKLEHLHSEPSRSGLDILMPTINYGNKGLLGICACLVSDSASITDFTTNIQLGLNSDGPFTTIKDSLLDKGAQESSPEQCTCLHSTDIDNALEVLRSTTTLPLGQKTPVIIDGLSLIRDYTLVQNLRFSDSGEQRPIVVVAEYTERHHIERLANDFDFWEIHNSEIENL
jgi:hypothetical protein